LSDTMAKRNTVSLLRTQRHSHTSNSLSRVPIPCSHSLIRSGDWHTLLDGPGGDPGDRLRLPRRYLVAWRDRHRDGGGTTTIFRYSSHAGTFCFRPLLNLFRLFLACMMLFLHSPFLPSASRLACPLSPFPNLLRISVPTMPHSRQSS
jgi:hypothetical protein